MVDQLIQYTSSKDPYKVLGISQQATIEEIKKAYFTLIKEYPPETQSEVFKKIRNAYEQIRSQKKRAETDFLLFDQGQSAREFCELKTPGPNIWDDLIDIEIWKLVRDPVQDTR